MPNGERWHQSKGVPLTIVAFLLIQSIALGFFGATMASGIENNSANIIKLEQANQRQWDKILNFMLKASASK